MGIVSLQRGYKGFNIVRYKGKFYGMSQALGPLDLLTTEEKVLVTYQQDGHCVIGENIHDVKCLINKRSKSFEVR